MLRILDRQIPRAALARGIVAAPMRAAHRGVLLVGLGLVAGAGDGHAGTSAERDARVCAEAIHNEERRRAYPGDLLMAIALVESGRFDKRLGLKAPWPWTVTAGGRGRFFANKAGALAAIRDLRASGVASIDVGCMQVNLYYHARAFASIEDALDPAQNVTYAGSFLTDLAVRTGSWFSAVGRYHSGTAEYAKRYRTKVIAVRDARRRRDPGGLQGPADVEQPEDGAGLLAADEAATAPDLPTVLRGSARGQGPARVFAPGRIVLPIILRGERSRSSDSAPDR